MFKLAHISDIHLGPLPPVSKRELVSKRIAGYINWKRNRSKHQDQNITASLLKYMNSLNPDHQIITGDLINLGLDSEIENAQKWLEKSFAPRDTTVICGNHDAYVRGSLAKAFKAWSPWIVGDKNKPIKTDKDFPSVRRRGKISIISCNSARASAPFLATGYFKYDQAIRLKEILEVERKTGQCRIVIIHHAPFPNATQKHKRLLGLNNFLQVIKTEGAELILHGHTHLDTHSKIKGPDSDVPVICVPAAYQWAGHKKPASGVNIYNIEKSDKTWQIEVERHGLLKETDTNFSLINKTKF